MSLFHRLLRLTRAAAAPLLAVVVAAVTTASPAFAQAPRSSVSLSFVQPTGVVSATASIPVLVRLTNSSNLNLVVNNALPNLGLDASFLPAQGYYFDPATQAFVFSNFASYTSASLGFALGCNNTFANNCSQGTPYQFNFASSAAFTPPFTLAAGASLQYLFGTFVPSAGPVPAGTYVFYDSELALTITGLDGAGRSITSNGNLAATCVSQNPLSCPGVLFSRTVTPVPEPAGWALMAAGLAAVSWRLRARRLA